MTYTKTIWQDLPNQTTPINANNLSNIENGVKEHDNKLIDIANKIIYDSGYDTTGYHYYVRFTDGLMIKWGYYTIEQISSENGFTKTINMEIPFVNTEYIVMTTKRMGGATNFSNLVDSVDINSTSEFSIITWCNEGTFENGTNSYFCIGYWK